MQRIAYQMLSLILLLGGTACNDNDFKGAAPKAADAEPEKPDEEPKLVTNTVYIKKDMEAKVSEPFKVASGSLDLKIDSDISSTTKESIKILPKLSIYFAIDRSSSMGPQLDNAKKNIQAFAGSLEASGFKANFGVLAFEDPITHSTKLSDLSTFQSYLDSIPLAPAIGGTNVDFQEGGLGALLQASTSLAAEVKESDTVPIIVYVSDEVGHKGGQNGVSARDCSIDEFVASMKTSFGKRIKLFYSVAPTPTKADVRNSPTCKFKNVDEQYDTLMSAIQADSNGSYRGAKLRWPFDEAVLTQELPNLIKNELQPKEKTCRATHVSFSKDGKEIQSWSKDKLKVGTDGSIVFKNSLTAENLEASVGDTLNVSITRCCDAEAGAQCKDEVKQSVDFQLSKD